ncbi:hypothetical protein GYMLUDRAFT_260282 [Collybiopsis luxurians FD-317 M1]|uniref:Anaphase-promoting complex subunit 4 WD40 domain-containing protein n=1 Tax=Collybiopsis luxurians FD-317 M1 TaxID=944289 RepID=A0A0D0CIS2_9AGAR|nr:hypothetical protein GYMLUDRAFT_260282 [Collybiopsis luxurians FD-317 M1]
MSKRSASPPGGSLIKRAKNDSPGPSTSREIAISSNDGDPRNKSLIRTVQRTSTLSAPIISLAGAHASNGSDINSCRFSPSGMNIAACSTDRSLSLWETYGANTNYGLISNVAKAPLLDLQWSLTQPWVYVAAADATLAVVDTTTGERLRRVRAHGSGYAGGGGTSGIINALDRTIAGGGGTELIVTGSDDGTVKIWEATGEDGLEKYPVNTIDIGCPVTGVCWAKDGTNVFVASLDNEIHVYDIRNITPAQSQNTYPRTQPLYSLSGHTDTPTSLSLSPSGEYLLSPSLSSNVLIHDIKPFSANPSRVHRTLRGAPAGWENTLLRGAWSKHDGLTNGRGGSMAAVGGADRMVCVWEVETGKTLYKLPGHKGTVTCVDFHPKEPILLTGSKDGTMLLGELDPGVSV